MNEASNQPVQPLPPQPGESNGLSIASLILGIVSIPTSFCYGGGILFAIAAIITGSISRSRAKKAGLPVNGMTKAGLIIGWIVTAIGILAVLVITILLLLGPAIGNVFSQINTSLQ